LGYLLAQNVGGGEKRAKKRKKKKKKKRKGELIGVCRLFFSPETFNMCGWSLFLLFV
jgi:hypothetical protein